MASPRVFSFLACALALLGVILALEAQAVTVPTGFEATLVAGGLSDPTAMAFAPDDRLFVAQQGGALRVIKNGGLLSTPFVTVTVDALGERGLLGVAVDPDFATTQWIYVYYTVPGSPPHNRVSRFTASGDVAESGSEVILLELDSLSSATNHNGGALHFAADDTLFVAVGENAAGANAQTLGNLLGKMLRINRDGTIPADNPFYETASGKNRAIWVFGLRNPFTFAFQPGTGRMFINDVGANAWEEINDGQPGANYGWPATEGYTTNPSYNSPFYAYANDASTCAITGGVFYDPPAPQFPAQYEGWYFFADYCGGWVKRVDPGSPAGNPTLLDFATGISLPVDLSVGPDGALYYLARGSGAVFRVAYSPGQAPAITTQPASPQVGVGQSATFDVTASGTPPLTFQWKRNGQNIRGATAATYTLPSASLADDGAAFQCQVSNAFGSATSNPATLDVVTGGQNQAPTGTITAPVTGALYSAGQTVTYAGTASDPEDGALPASAFTWWVVFHHDDHTHPFLPETNGATGGTFIIPTTGETSANVWYRIHLRVTDSGGITHVSYRDVLPRTVTLTLATAPAGLDLTLDAQPVTAPFSVQAVVGMLRTLGAPLSQTLTGQNYTFRSWSDRGAATHAITVPSTSKTYTATYQLVGGAP